MTLQSLGKGVMNEWYFRVEISLILASYVNLVAKNYTIGQHFALNVAVRQRNSGAIKNANR